MMRESKEDRASTEHPRESVDNGIAFAEKRGDQRHPDGKSTTSRRGVYLFSGAVFAACALLTFLLISLLYFDRWLALVISLVVGLVSMLSVHMTLEWEQAVVLRLGKLHRIAGPGVFFTIPFVEYPTIRIDKRMRCTFFSGEQILTADLVPVNVNAVFFWTVWSAKKASAEVEDYLHSVTSTAQACMRDVIGSMEIEELATRRKQIDNEIRDQIAEITEPWGISVTTVKIRDIVVPESLQDSLSRAAQAQRERDARIILTEVEKDISSMLVEAANIYAENERAMQLRAMHAVNDGVRDGGGMVVVPSSLGDSFSRTADFLKRL